MMRAMALLVPAPPSPPVVHERSDGRPLAWIASCDGGGAGRRRKDARIAAVLEEFGYRTWVADGDDDVLADASLGGAELVVCDVVRPDCDLPVELAVAATRGIAAMVLMPEGVEIDGLARGILSDCRAQIVRYFRVEPARALHERLAGRTA